MMTDLPDLDTIVADRAAPWRHLAACRGAVDLFYPAGYNGQREQEQVARAVAVCAACPVVDPCRAEADADGIWAGTTPPERGHRRTRPRRTEVPAATPPARPAVEAPWERDGLALTQALRIVARHGRVALRSRTDPGAGTISRRAGRALRDYGLIERDRTVAVTGACWVVTQAGRELAAQLGPAQAVG